MNIDFLLNYVNLVTLGICLCLGYVIKNSLDFIQNKYIPLIMLCFGTIINILCNLHNINAAVVLGGMISGLASTGLYEAMRNLINKDNAKEDK
jgi:anaerobic C4-dicarboxylate transporter